MGSRAVSYLTHHRGRVLGIVSCLSLATGLLTPIVYAQDEPAGGRIKIGETDLYPSLRLEYGVNDNAFLENENVEDTTKVSVKPRLIWLADQRSTSLRAEYRGDVSSHSERALDYDEHGLFLDGNSVLARRWRVAGNFSVERRTQDLGTGRTRENVRSFDEPFTFNDIRASAVGTFGADRARGNLEFGIRTLKRDAKNLPEVAGGFSFTQIAPFVLFSLRLSADTRLTFEARFSDLEFDQESANRTATAFLIGARFAATGKLTGFFKVGASMNDFDDEAVDDRTNLVGSAEMRYQLTSRARLSLIAEIEDTDGFRSADVDNRTVKSDVRLQWDQRFSEQVYHRAFIESTGEAATCPERGIAELGLGYELGVSLRQWVDVGAYYGAKNRELADCTADFGPESDFDNQRIGVFINVTL